jgi:Flp pilus assembly protein protease CpaA
MERIADSIGILTLGILSWQDFRSRQIAWWLLPVLAVVFFLSACAKNSTREIGIGFSLNLVFLCMQFVFVWIWFSVKEKKLSKLIDTQIGLGDVLFMICVALAFSPANFIVFCTMGMMVTLVVAIAIRLFHSTSRSEIPLAGALAIPLMILCAWRVFDPRANFYNDEWLDRFFLDYL